MAIRRTKVTVTATGSDGSAQGSSKTFKPVSGYIERIYFKRVDTPQDTTLVRVEEATEDPALTVLEVDGLTGDQWYHPRTVVHNSETGEELEGPVDLIHVGDNLRLVVETADDGSVIEATIIYDDSPKAVTPLPV
jgi:hypothetical protein